MLAQVALGAYDIFGQRGNATKCGNPGDDIQMRIIGGDDFERGDFPWMVALTKNHRSQAPVFFGAGTLVSSRHVITGND